MFPRPSTKACGFRQLHFSVQRYFAIHHVCWYYIWHKAMILRLIVNHANQSSSFLLLNSSGGYAHSFWFYLIIYYFIVWLFSLLLSKRWPSPPTCFPLFSFPAACCSPSLLLARCQRWAGMPPTSLIYQQIAMVCSLFTAAVFTTVKWQAESH